MKQHDVQRQYIQFSWIKLFTVLSMTLLFNVAYAQDQEVQGIITDESKNPIFGATISLKGTMTGALSDANGKFTLNVPADNKILVVSFIGYETQEIDVKNLSNINVVMFEKIEELDNIVVIGYGQQKKSDLTGAVATVSSEDLNKTPSTNALQAMQGKAAGVQIFSAGGMPGKAPIVRIRGINTITKSNEYTGVSGPIYVIDGIPGDITNINQNDIEHIEVLKDASAQAIYGSSGGNGVILVTTKQGKKNQKTKVELSMYRGIQSNDIPVEMTNTREYIEIYNSLDVTKKSRITADPDSLPSTDWWDEITHNAIMEQYDITVSSGTENSTSLLSIGYLKQDGIIKKSNYSRYNIRSNISFDINKRIKIGENINLYATRGRGNDGWGAPYGAINHSPISYIRDTTANLSAEEIKNKNIGWGGWAQPLFNTGTGNPVAGIYYDNATHGTYGMVGNFYTKVELLKGLTYNQNFGFDINFYEEDNFRPYFYISATQNNGVVQVSRTLNRNFSWNWQHVLNYKTTLFEKHTFDVMAGFEANEYLGKTLSGNADSLIKNGATPEYQYIDATLRQSGSFYYYSHGGYGHGSGYAYFGRINYDYNNLILAQFSYRYDGSTKFGPGYRFGGFPAFSAGLKLTELDVVKNNLPFLSFGKIRLGWGKTGNDGIPGDKFYSLVDVSSTYGYPLGGNGTAGGVALAPGNPELHWETITTFNYGLDANFLNNRLSLTADYFDKKTTGMLQSLSLPLIAGRYGFSGSDGSYIDHIGSLSNKGIELTLGYKDRVGDLKYSVDFNLTKIVSKLYDLSDTITLPTWDTNPKAIIRNGDAPGAFWGYKTDGIFRPEDADSILDPGAKKPRYVAINQPYTVDNKGRKIFLQNTAQPGDVRFIDLNGDTIINNLDQTVIGNPNPKFTYGFSINLEYKNFDLNCFFQGSYGNQIFNANKINWYNSSGQGNWVKDALNAYREPVYDENGVMTDPGNTTSDQFRLYGSTANNYKMSDWYVEDGSYLRLKSLQIGYTLPSDLSRKIGIERLRVYVGGSNLITWTKYSGMDPEIASNDPTYFGIDSGVYPQAKMHNIGVNVTF